MSLLDTVRSAKHRGRTPKQLREAIVERDARIADLEARVLVLAEERDQLEADNHSYATTMAGARTRIEDLAAMLEQRNRRIIIDAADRARLRQALINARPRITEAHNPARIPPFAPSAPDEPWTVPDEQTGQALPVGRWLPFPPDPDGDETQKLALALLDLPDPRPAGWESLAKQPA